MRKRGIRGRNDENNKKRMSKIKRNYELKRRVEA